MIMDEEVLIEQSIKNFYRQLSDDRVYDITGLDEVEPVINLSLIRDFMQQPVSFSFNSEGELSFVDEKGEVIIIDPLYRNVNYEKTMDAILGALPDCNFDTDCGGNRSMQEETAAIYKVLVFNKIMDNLYSDEIELILQEYDFQRMKNAKGEQAFTILLGEMQKESTPVTKIILQSLTSKLSVFKAKKDYSYNGIVSEADALELAILIRLIGDENYKTNQLLAKEPDRFARLKILNKSQEVINQIIRKESDKIQLLYMVYKMDTNFVPSLVQRKIRISAKKFIEKLIEDKTVTDVNVANSLRISLIKRAKRRILIDIKREKYIKFSKGEYENLIPKI